MTAMIKGKSLIFYLFLILTAVLIGGAAGFLVYSNWQLPEILDPRRVQAEHYVAGLFR